MSVRSRLTRHAESWAPKYVATTHPDAALKDLTGAVNRAVASVRFDAPRIMAKRSERIWRMLYAKLYFCLPHISEVDDVTLAKWTSTVNHCMRDEFEWPGKPSALWVSCVSGLPSIRHLYHACRASELSHALNGVSSTVSVLYAHLAAYPGNDRNLVKDRLEASRRDASVSFTDKSFYQPPGLTKDTYTVDVDGRRLSLRSSP